MRLPASLLLLWPLAATAGESPDFGSEIQPILAENCFPCHGPDDKARKSKLRLDTFEGATTSGELGEAIVPGKPEESELVVRILSEDGDERMPPPKSKRSLTPAQLKRLKDWIAAGAEYEEHWAWQEPERPAIPVVKASSLVRNPIDAFLLRRLEDEGLTYSPATDPALLLRRLSLDLIGLPPTPDELHEFKTALGSPQGAERAYQAVVDRLLASARFGERWARPWLDLARYADSNGFQADQLRPSWSFRDWVIRALNDNMPFDQFTIEQLAGDLLPNATLEQKTATGFHRTVTCNVEAGVNPEGNRVNQVIDRVNTTGTVWLGVTMECAQCHNHKYDPFTMKDYYALFDFFNHTPLEVQLPSNKTDVSHDFIGPFLDLPLPADQADRAALLDRELATAGKEAENLLAHPANGFAAWEGKALEDTGVPGEIAKILRLPREKRNGKQKNKLKAHFRTTTPELKQIDQKIARLKKERGNIRSTRTLVMVEMEKRRKTHILTRGNFLAPAQQVQADAPAALPKLATAGRPATPLPGKDGKAATAPNRLALARWLVRRDNPLTARVTVNRWWAELFGNGIVATLEDFGTQSEPPTHPALLDWLAVEFMESGWDKKHVLKTIVLSQAYRQSSRLTPALAEKDPRNLLLARAPRFRMDAERIRDNALAISGLLSSRMYGEPVMPYQPPGLWRQTGRNEPKWVEAKDEDRWRRGIYIVYRRAAPYPSMVNFDAPDRAACMVARSRTNTPSQALTLLNDPAFVEMALALADRILEKAGSPETRIHHAFQLVLARSPSDRELKIVDDLLRDRLKHFQQNPSEVEALLSNSSFAYRPRSRNRPELAAWFYVANAFLNLDETITRN